MSDHQLETDFETLLQNVKSKIASLKNHHSAVEMSADETPANFATEYSNLQRQLEELQFKLEYILGRGTEPDYGLKPDRSTLEKLKQTKSNLCDKVNEFLQRGSEENS